MSAFLKKLLSVAIIALLCINVVYCIEVTTTPTPEPSPEVTPVPVPEASPTPAPEISPTPTPSLETPPPTDQIQEEAPEEQSPADIEKQKQEEQRLAEAEKFKEDIGKMIKKRMDSYYKNGGRGVIGIYIKELGTDFDYGYNEEKTNTDNPDEGYFNTASTCKMFAAATVYYLENIKELEADKTFKDSVTGWKYNLKKMIYKMVSHSVNDYFNITLRHLGSKRINEVIAQLGTKHSYVYSEIMPAAGTSVSNNIRRYGICRSPRTTPKDLAHILELVYKGETFGKQNDALFIGSLKDNIYSSRLPKGISYRSVVAHKTGTSAGEGVYNDAGIIYLKDNPYIMVVMSKGSPSGVQSFYYRICKDVYDYMKKRAQK